MTTQLPSITQAIREEAITQLCEKLKSYYVFVDTADQMVAHLEQNLKDGVYGQLEDPKEFAMALSEDMQLISKDKHLRVHFSEQESSTEGEQNEKEMQEEFLRMAEAKNYYFTKVERLPGNIGYIDLRAFFEPEIAGEMATAAMNLVAATDALIFDLRKNMGGSPKMVALLTSYLFEEHTHLNDFYYRPDDSYAQSWTLPFVPGKKYLNKPVYILSSNYTFSGGEEFINNLKVLGRAKVFGETTGGGANPGQYYQLTANFRAFVPEGRAINPITKTNWEGVGVEPDVKVPKEEALDAAYKEALEHVRNKYKEQPKYQFLVEEVNSKLAELE